MNKSMKLSLAAGMAISSVFAGTAAGQTYNWANAVDGVWNAAGNWSPAAIPNSGSHDAVLGLTGPYTASMNISTLLRSLTISNSSAVLQINSGLTLSFAGVSSITSSGRIVVGTGTTSGTAIVFPDGGRVSGGVINLNPANGYYDRAILATGHSNTDTATLGAGTTINGEGILTGLFFNEATIAGGPNNGVTIANLVIQQGAGQVLVVGNNKRASIGNGGYVMGGTFNALAGGLVAVVGGQGGSVDGVTNAGPFLVSPGGTLYVTGAGLTNNGTLTVNSGSTSGTAVVINQGATLGGTGFVDFSPSNGYYDRAYITTGTNGTATGNLGAGLTLRGEGTLYGVLNSQAVIAGGINTGPVINALFTQSGAGRFSVNGPGLTATIGGGTVAGGVFETSNGGLVATLSGQTGTVSGVTNNGAFRVSPGSTLRVTANDFVNNGTVNVNNGSTSTATIELADGAEIGGNGTVTFSPANGYVDRAVLRTTTTNGTASIGPNATVNGEGTITAYLNNSGTIGGGNNTGPIVDGVITQVGAGRMFASGAGQFASIGNGTVIGGTFGTNGGLISTVGGRTGSVSGVTNLGAFRVAAGSTLRVLTGGFTNNSAVYINSGSTSTALLEIGDNATLGGTGTISMTPANGYVDRAGITSTTNSGTAVLGTGLTIDGEGTIWAHAINRATIAGGPNTGPIVQGVLTQQNGGRFFVSGAGETASIGNGTVRGGTFETASGGRVATVGGQTGSVESVTNTGTFVIRAGSGLSVLPGGMTNTGSMYVNDGGTSTATLWLNSGSTVSGTGTITLNPAAGYFDRSLIQTTSGNTDTATIGAGQTINGNGQILGIIMNNGRIAPGVGIGRIERPGSITQGSTGVIEIEMAGNAASQRDILTGSGVLRLGGTLRVRFLGGYLPGVCSTYAAITGGQISGQFAAIDQPPTGHGSNPITVRYSPTAVTILYRPQDVNHDDVVDFFDYLDFLSAFSTASPEGDYNHDDSIDFFDYLDFVQDFAAGGC